MLLNTVLIRILHITFFICLLLLVPAAYVVYTQSDRWQIFIDTEKVEPFNTGWAVYWPDGKISADFTLPQKYNLAENRGKTTLVRTITGLESVDGGPTLLFKTVRQSVEIFVDTQLIYEYGIKGDTFAGETAGSAWHLVRINRVDEGKPVSVIITPQSSGDAAVLPSIMIGSKAACLFYLWSNSIPLLLICGIIAIFGVIFLLFYFYSLYKKHPFISFLYLGCISLMADFWFFLDGGLGIFLIPNAFTTCFLSFMITALLPLPLLFYLQNITSSAAEKAVYTVLAIASLATAFLLPLLSMAGIPLNRSSTLSHLLIILTISVMCYSVISASVKKHRPPDIRSAGLLCIGVAALIDVYRYYMGAPGLDGAVYTRIGFLLFIILQGIRAANSPFEVFAQDIRRQTLERIAFTDMMTSLKNRSAFDEEMERLDALPDRSSVQLILFDLNNLKKTNDAFGHKAGDYIIIAAADFFRQAFSSLGSIYRIGGDEFCIIILSGSIIKTMAAVSAFYGFLEKHNRTAPYSLSIACGYDVWNVRCDRSMDGFLARVDEIMYEDKRRQKRQYMPVPVS